MKSQIKTIEESLSGCRFDGLHWGEYCRQHPDILSPKTLNGTNGNGHVNGNGTELHLAWDGPELPCWEPRHPRPHKGALLRIVTRRGHREMLAANHRRI